MDDELSLLENELKSLRPAAPTAALARRIDGELATPVSRPARTWWWLVATLPLAAAATFFLVFTSRHAPAKAVVSRDPEPVAEFKPVAAENVLYAVRDEGLVTLEDGTAARRERLQYVDTITWRNPRTNASVRWTVPREEVRMVPVRFQ